MRVADGLVVATLALGSTSLALAANSVHVPNNIPPWLSQAKLVGPSDGTKQVAVAVHLQLSNVSGLQAFLHDLYSPGTASYGHYLTAAQFRATYSPSASAVAAVQAFLSQGGLKLSYTPANGSYVEAAGPIAQVAKLFGVTQKQFEYKGMELRANSEAPSVPDALAPFVSFIEGLDETESLIQSPFRLRGGVQPAAAPPMPIASPPPCSNYWADHSATVSPSAYQYGSTLPWANCGYTPQQVRAAYGTDRVSLTGAGVRIGIIDAFASPTIVDDVNRFSAHYGLPLLTPSNFQQIVVPGTYNYPANHLFNNSVWYVEEALDIEWAHAIAPGANIVFAGAQNDVTPLDHALIHLIDNQLADVISNSWGFWPSIDQYGAIEPLHAAFMQAAAEGISVVFVSGDWGDNLLLGGTIAESGYPASDPYVTVVGGTTLAILNASGDKKEWGWSTAISTLGSSAVSSDGTQVAGTTWSPWPPQVQAFWGSGGGLSSLYAQPDYQQGVVPNGLATSTIDSSGNPVTFSSPRRVSPDIALVADLWSSTVLIGATFTTSSDPVANVGCTTLTSSTEYCEALGGGTSGAGPQFAGILALIDQARFAAGKAAVGFVNPAMYRLQVGSAGSGAPIHDILPPETPLGSLFNAETSPGVFAGVQLFTINSAPLGTTGPVMEGVDTSLRVTKGYDNVTGLGVPNVPAFVDALSSLP